MILALLSEPEKAKEIGKEIANFEVRIANRKKVEDYPDCRLSISGCVNPDPEIPYSNYSNSQFEIRNFPLRPLK